MKVGKNEKIVNKQVNIEEQTTHCCEGGKQSRNGVTNSSKKGSKTLASQGE